MANAIAALGVSLWLLIVGYVCIRYGVEVVWRFLRDMFRWLPGVRSRPRPAVEPAVERCRCTPWGPLVDVDARDTLTGEPYTIRRVCSVCWLPREAVGALLPLPNLYAPEPLMLNAEVSNPAAAAFGAYERVRFGTSTEYQAGVAALRQTLADQSQRARALTEAWRIDGPNFVVTKEQHRQYVAAVDEVKQIRDMLKEAERMKPPAAPHPPPCWDPSFEEIRTGDGHVVVETNCTNCGRSHPAHGFPVPVRDPDTGEHLGAWIRLGVDGEAHAVEESCGRCGRPESDGHAHVDFLTGERVDAPG